MRLMLLLLLVIAGCTASPSPTPNPDEAALCTVLPALSEPWDRPAIFEAHTVVGQVASSKGVGSHLLEENLQNLYFSLGGLHTGLEQMSYEYDVPEPSRRHLARSEEGAREARAWLESEVCA